MSDFEKKLCALLANIYQELVIANVPANVRGDQRKLFSVQSLYNTVYQAQQEDADLDRQEWYKKTLEDLSNQIDDLLTDDCVDPSILDL